MNQEIGIAIKVGCSYKCDLGATHKKSDETWRHFGQVITDWWVGL